jgi:antitoxin VapB
MVRIKEGILMEIKAKVFTTGRSQAVRLPAAFRFETTEVFIRRDPGSGDVILSNRPRKKSWPEIFAILDAAGVPEDFLTDRDTSMPVEREWM